MKLFSIDFFLKAKIIRSPKFRHTGIFSFILIFFGVREDG